MLLNFLACLQGSRTLDHAPFGVKVVEIKFFFARSTGLKPYFFQWNKQRSMLLPMEKSMKFNKTNLFLNN
jgi:hypothetical protein